MAQTRNQGLDWLSKENETAKDLVERGTGVANPAASKPSRSLKGFRIREDYQRKFDELVAREKYNGKNGPALAEEALEMLFNKYKC